jgi:hypothetical protein
MAEPSPEHDRVGRQIVDAALAVHGTLGLGLISAWCRSNMAECSNSLFNRMTYAL